MQSTGWGLSFIAAIGCAITASAEPPPRDQRAPWTESRPGEVPAFRQTGWRPGYAIPPGWRPRYFYYESKYEWVDDGLGPILHASSDGTASWIMTQLEYDFDLEEPTCLNWAWSADTLPVLNADESTKAGDDFAIRFYVFGQTMSGEPYGFNYVWAVQHQQGEIWTSPFSDNKLMALQSGPNTTGRMVPESRNVVDDLERATGERPANIRAIAIMSDSEGSQSTSAARMSQFQIGECT